MLRKFGRFTNGPIGKISHVSGGREEGFGQKGDSVCVRVVGGTRGSAISEKTRRSEIVKQV